MNDNITIFKPEFYERTKERMSRLLEVEEALKLIKSDKQLQNILREYASTPSRSLNLYGKKYGVPRKMEEGKVLDVRLSLLPRDPIEFIFNSEKLYWYGDRKWFTTDHNWAVFYGGPDTGAGWATCFEQYSVKEDRNGFFVLRGITKLNSSYKGTYHEKRISQIKALKKVSKDEILSNLEIALKEICS